MWALPEVSWKFSGNLLLESSDSAWVPPESFYKVLRQSAGIGALCSGDGSTGELSQSPLAIYFWSLRILHGYHRRASVKPSGCLLLESSDSAWVPPESFYKVLRQSAGIGALCSGDGSTGELSQSPLAIYFWSLRILHGYHRRASVKPSGCLLLESSDSSWVSPEALFFTTKNTPGLL